MSHFELFLEHSLIRSLLFDITLLSLSEFLLVNYTLYLLLRGNFVIVLSVS